MPQSPPTPTTPSAVGGSPAADTSATARGQDQSRSVRVLRRAIAVVIVVAFGLAAAGGIIVLLGDIESEATYKVIGTTALTGAVSTAAFCGATLIGRRTQWFGIVTIGAAAVTMALSLWFIWGDPYVDPDNFELEEVLFQVLTSFALVTAVASISSLILLLTRSPSRVVMIGLPITLCLLTFGTLLFLIIIWVESAWDVDWLTRLNGIVWILAAFGVVVVPLSSLLLRAGAKPAPVSTAEAPVQTETAAPADDDEERLVGSTLSPSAVDRLETTARAEGITADELVDRLLTSDSRAGDSRSADPRSADPRSAAGTTSSPDDPATEPDSRPGH